MFLLSLVAALCGSPLRLAEAAEDFAEALSERDDRPMVEQLDGGVGDDPELAIKSAAKPLVSTDCPDAGPAAWDLSNLPLRIPSARLAEIRPAPPPGVPRRLAWLQRFLC